MLFLAQLDEMFQQVGGQVSNLLTQYIPAEQVDLIRAKLPETFVMPSPVMLLVYSLAAIFALAVLEQVKYQVERMGKGKRLPGESTSTPRFECISFVVDTAGDVKLLLEFLLSVPSVVSIETHLLSGSCCCFICQTSLQTFVVKPCVLPA